MGGTGGSPVDAEMDGPSLNLMLIKMMSDEDPQRHATEGSRWHQVVSQLSLVAKPWYGRYANGRK